jgi:site-specific DNA recombinase
MDAKKIKSIVAIKPKPPFKPVFRVAASKKGSEIGILKEPLQGSSVFLVETGEGRTLPETMLCYSPFSSLQLI